jgi:hypothetical protein
MIVAQRIPYHHNGIESKIGEISEINNEHCYFAPSSDSLVHGERNDHYPQA